MNQPFIQNLTVSNYKIFKSLKVDTFKRINIIGGKNGVGKTTFLEVIYFLRSTNGFESFSRRGIPFTGTTLSSAFYKLQDEEGAEISVSGNSTIGILKRRITVERYVEKYAENVIPQGNMGLMTFQKGNKKAKTLRFEYMARGALLLTGTLDVLDGIPQNYVEKPGDEQIVQPSGGWGTSLVNATDIDEMVTRISLDNRKQEFINNLHMIDASVEDILVGRADEKSLVALRYQNMWLPLSACGGGMVALTNIVLTVMNCQNGFVVADLIDAELHHSVVKGCWKALALLSQKYNCQLFFTTHSVENLQKAYQGIEEAGTLDDLLYIRLDKSEGKCMATSYTAEELHDSLEFNIDVR